MPQLNILTIGKVQHTDIKSNNANDSMKKTAAEGAFSDVIDQHYQERHTVSIDKNAKDNGKNQPKAADGIKVSQAHSAANKTVKINNNAKELSSSKEDRLSIVIAEEDQDNIKAQYLKKYFEAEENGHILPVPVVPEIKGEGLVTNVELEGESDISAIPVSLLSTTQEQVDVYSVDVQLADTLLIQKGATLNSVENTQHSCQYKNDSNEHKLSALTQSMRQENSQTQSLDGDDDEAIDLLKMLSGAQKLLIKADVEKIAGTPGHNSTDSDKAVVIKPQVNNDQLLKTMKRQNVDVASEETIKQSQYATRQEKSPINSDPETEASKLNTTADNNTVVTQLGRVDKKSEDISAKNLINTIHNTLNNEPLSQTTAEEQAKLTSSMAKLAVTSSTTNQNNVNANEMNEIEKAKVLAMDSKETLLESDSANDKSIINATSAVANKSLDSVTSVVENKVLNNAISTVENRSLGNQNQVTVQPEDDTQLRGQMSEPTLIKNDVVSDTRAVRIPNPSTATIVASSDVKSQEQVLDAQNKHDKESNGMAEHENDEINLTKTNNEKFSSTADKVASVVNQTIEAQASRAAINSVVSSEELARQHEQSFEHAMSKLNSNTVQTQKQINAFNMETISIYRKDFADAVKDKVMVMINQKIQQIEIQLDPPEMGNVHVKVNFQNEQAAVQFVVQNQQAKEALEQNMGKLRDMLSDSGVDVGDANIEQRGAGDQAQDDLPKNDSSGQHNAISEQESSEQQVQVGHILNTSSTGVDHYA